MSDNIQKLAAKTITRLAFDMAADDQVTEERKVSHPIHKLLEIINTTPVDMLVHSYDQKADGSMEIKFKIPSRAEQAKQKAMEQAMQQQQQMGPAAQAVPEVNDMMDSSPATADQSSKPSTAKSNVEIRVAMSKADASKALKGKFPEGFLKSMDLV